jgi:hypothetical protein
MDGLCPTSLEPLVTHFRRLSTQGRGDGARGRNFHALFVLEFAYRERLLAFHPSRRPSDWLAMLFDLVSEFQEAYLSRDVCEEAVIRARLQQSWQAFLQDLRSAGLSHVAEVTDAVVKRRVAATVELWLRPELLGEANVDSLALCEVFDLLPPLKSATKDRSKHPAGSTLRKDLSRYNGERRAIALSFPGTDFLLQRTLVRNAPA